MQVFSLSPAFENLRGKSRIEYSREGFHSRLRLKDCFLKSSYKFLLQDFSPYHLLQRLPWQKWRGIFPRGRLQSKFKFIGLQKSPSGFFIGCSKIVYHPIGLFNLNLASRANCEYYWFDDIPYPFVPHGTNDDWSLLVIL